MDFIRLSDGTVVLPNLQTRFLNGAKPTNSTGLISSKKRITQLPIQQKLAPKLNPIKIKYTLLDFAPYRLSQGRQGSCVGWATAYAGVSISYRVLYGDSLTFSPSFLYNNIKIEHCDSGAYIEDALDFIVDIGSVPFNKFFYDETECHRLGDHTDLKLAREYKVRGWASLKESTEKVSLESIKQHISNQIPVVISFKIPKNSNGSSTFYELDGKEFWQPEPQDYSTQNFGYHAMCVIGYDDTKGAFQIMNSWGDGFGIQGIIWVRYNDFQQFAREAYAMYVLRDDNNFKKSPLIASLSAEQRPVSLYSNNGEAVVNKTNLKTNTYTLNVSNRSSVHFYVIGKKNNGAFDLLFPKKGSNVSSFLGLKGNRQITLPFKETNTSFSQYTIIASQDPLNIDSLITEGRQVRLKNSLVEWTTSTNAQIDKNELILRGVDSKRKVVCMEVYLNKH